MCAMSTMERFPCVCCGHLVMPEKAGSFDICPICFWEDDIVQLAFPMLAGGANAVSLYAGQMSYQKVGASEIRFVKEVRRTGPLEVQEEGWRPWDLSKDVYLRWESANDQELWKKAGNGQQLYWWRADYWLHQETPGWVFFGARCDGESCVIDGVDVWKGKWVDRPGEQAIVRDPHHGRLFRFRVTEVAASGRRALFAAGEFSNGVWGFYLPVPEIKAMEAK